MICSCIYYFPMFLFSGITAIRIMLKESGHIILCSTAVRLYKVIHKSWYIWHSPVPGNIFRWDFHFLRLILMALNFHGNWFFFKIPKDCFYSDNVYLRKFKFQHLGVILGAHRTPKIGCFSKIYEIALLLSSNKATHPTPENI